MKKPNNEHKVRNDLQVILNAKELHEMGAISKKEYKVYRDDYKKNYGTHFEDDLAKTKQTIKQNKKKTSNCLIIFTFIIIILYYVFKQKTTGSI